MFREKSTQEESNFWISYADLMAGLLFVFILLVGAIVSKSIILKLDLHAKEFKLSQTEKDLISKQGKLVLLTSDIENKKSKLILRDDEIKKLNKLLLEINTKNDQLNGKIVIVQNLLDTEKSKNIKNEKSLRDYQDKVVILSNQLTDTNSTLKLKDEELLKLLNALDEKETQYDKIVAALQKQKAQIKSLTGIKIKVIAMLKDELGDKITIDPKSGSLKFSSNILFDVSSAELKEEAKTELKTAFEEYIGALVTNDFIKPHLDKIVIEGHTDSDGGYLYNLDLSQKRAFAVMNYLLTLDLIEKYNIKPLMTASGRAFIDAIQTNGIEDKNASRRIEIQFRLKNDDAMHEIEKVLDAQ